VVEHDGKLYVHLHNDFRGMMAVFRMQNDGQLKRLRRWPKAVGSQRAETVDEYLDDPAKPVLEPRYPMPSEENGYACQYCGKRGGHYDR
jgi:hypothetical protein